MNRDTEMGEAQRSRAPDDATGSASVVAGGVTSKVAKGAAWMIAARMLESGVGTISTIILARLLVPEDFGLVALAGSLAAMLALLRSFSFDIVLIQRQSADREEYDTAWTLNAALSAMIAAVLVGGAFPFAWIYGDPRLVGIVWLIALAKLIEGFENIGIVNFRKDLLFGKEFLFVFLRRAGSFVISVGLAITYRNYWALVIGIAAGQALSTALSYALHPYRPRLTTSAWRGLFDFSKWNAINAVAHAISIRAGDFLVGKMAGPAGLGVFTLSNEIAFLPASELGAPINRAVYPGYARVAHDLGLLRNAFYKVSSLITAGVVPAAVGLASIADSLVPIMLGEKWLMAIPLVPVLAIRGLTHALVANVPYVYLALGKPRLATYALVARAVMLLPLLWVGLQVWGVFGAACAFAGSMALEIPIHLLILRHELEIRIAVVLQSLWRPAVAAAFMALCVRWLTLEWVAPEAIPAALFRLGVLVGFGATAYVISILVLWQLSGRTPGAERMVFDALRARVAGWYGQGRAT